MNAIKIDMNSFHVLIKKCQRCERKQSEGKAFCSANERDLQQNVSSLCSSGQTLLCTWKSATLSALKDSLCCPRRTV